MIMNQKVAVVGYGWVGKAMYKLFPDAVVYDKHQPTIEVLNEATGESKQLKFSKEDVNSCNMAFIAVPTPNKKDGSLDCSIVEEVIKWCSCPLLIIRSTVQPGFCNEMSKKYCRNIVFQPEYLGETPSHPMLDPRTRQFVILGGDAKDRRKVINLYTSVYNANMTIRQVTCLEAEIIKLSENRAIAFKVAQCQELYDACEKAGVDYYTIRDAVYSDDPRFTLWFTFVFPEKRGFNSKCIPKDVYGWCAWAESVGYEPELTKAMLKANNKYLKA